MQINYKITNNFNNIRLIATDMDGTLTKNGRFSTELLQNLEALAKANIDVLIITGRAAGWVEAVRNYLPIVGAIAENGGLFYRELGTDPEFLVPITDINIHRQKLADTFAFLQTNFPQIKESSDNRFRLTDWTFDVAGLSLLEIKELASLSERQGWSFTYSNVQCHIKPMQQDKANGLFKVIDRYFSNLNIEEIVTVGDSPNDESLFDRNLFPNSVGVGNASHYLLQMQHQPNYITQGWEIAGFVELATSILDRQ
jgi:HAD superfamily hydrolase (TIGR01484 family)